MEECIVTERKKNLLQELEEAPTKSLPIRTIKCRKKKCSQMDFSTDFNKEKIKNILAGVPSKIQSFFVTSYQTLANKEGNVHLKKKCPDKSLVSFVSLELKPTTYTVKVEYKCNRFCLFGCRKCHRDQQRFGVTITRKVECRYIDQNAGVIVHDDDEKESEWVSSGSSGSETAQCPENYYVGGVECEKNPSHEDNCNTMRLLCKKIEVSVIV